MNETTEKRQTSAEIKKQIDEATKAMKEQKTKTELLNSGLPITAIADRINANSTTETPKAESKSQPAATTEPTTEKETAPNQDSVDVKEWAKKKGINWETSDSVLFELRKKDQEFHRKAAEKKREMAERPPYQNGWTPNQAPQPYQPQNNYPAYNPPQAPMNRQQLENVARQFNVLPEDFEKVFGIANAVTQLQLQQERQRRAAEDEAMKRENIKNSEFRELSADPVFRRPEVAKEFHDVLEQLQESDPESFTQDPYAYRKAFERALQNIGRRNLEGSVQQFESTNSFQLPKTPPKSLGNGSGGGREANENSLTQSEFEKLPVSKQRDYLESLGLVQPKY